MDDDRVLDLLAAAAEHLGRMLVTYELGVSHPPEMPEELKPSWVKFQGTVRELLRSSFDVPKSWTILAFSRVPVPDVHCEERPDDESTVGIRLQVEKQQFKHGVKIDYESWSNVCNEIIAEIEIIKARGDHGEQSSPMPPENKRAVNEDDLWPQVNLGLNHVTWSDVCYEVAGEAALLFDALVKAEGDYIAANAVTSKAYRVFDKLPKELQTLIDRSPKGYRLVLPT